MNALPKTRPPVSRILRAASILLAISLSRSATAADFYVSPSGNDANPGTQAAPFATIPKAISVVAAGDTIYLRGGTHSYSSTIVIGKSGTVAAPIRLLAFPGEQPLIDFSTQPYGSANRGVLLNTNGNYWQFKGLEIAHAGDNGVKVEGSHLRFEQCVFHHNGDSGMQIGFGHDTDNPGANLAAFIEVINCDSYRNYDPDNRGSDADGFAAKLHCGQGIFFSGCRAWENSDDGWDLFETDASVVISNCWTWHSGDGALFPGSGSFQGNGNGFKLGGNGTGGSSVGTHSALRCVAFNCKFKSNAQGFTSNSHKDGEVLYNCLSFSNGTSAYNYFFEGTVNSGKQNVFKNNVSIPRTGSNGGGFITDAPDVEQNNSWNLSVTVNAADYMDLTEAAAAAPRQADGSLPNNGFAKLVSGSDLIDKGVDVGFPFGGSAPDLGPFEFGTVTPPNPPAAPSGLSATAVSSSQINLAWTDNANNETGFKIERSTNGTSFTQIATVGANVTTFSDTGRTPSTTYWYRVRANNSGGDSTYSNTANATTLPAGNNAPSVAISAPINGATFTAPANITVSANASDSDGTVTSVQFFANGSPIGTDTTSPYSISWNSVAAGSYSLTAVATDNGGAQTTSSGVNITVNPPGNSPPTVSITAPINGATFTAPATITVSANASDSDGTISSVQFFANGSSIGTDTTSPYSISWNNVAAGSYSLTAVATDNGGAQTTSSGVSITVNPPGGGTTVTLASVAAEDGRILESSEGSNTGGSVNSSDATTSALRTGDDSSDRQYKTVLSFDTSSIPDGATIVSATLRLRRGSLTGTSPFTTHGSCLVDIKGGTGFNGSAALQTTDFQAPADAAQVATISNPAADGDLSSGGINATGRGFINKTGRTQFRVYFSADDNDDAGNDYIGWFSGNDTTAGNRPTLEITYQ